MTNSHIKLLRFIRRGKLHEANVLFADIMQQKSADRLSEERKGLMKEDGDGLSSDCCGSTITNGRCDECSYPCKGVKRKGIKEESKSIAMECMECGKKFKSSNTSDPKCPKCGGYDIDLAESRKLGKTLKEGYEPGTRVRIKGTPSGNRKSLPAANWVDRDFLPSGKGNVVTLLDYAPNEGTLDVIDVKLPDGSEESIYDFNIIGKA